MNFPLKIRVDMYGIHLLALNSLALLFFEPRNLRHLYIALEPTESIFET